MEISLERRGTVDVLTVHGSIRAEDNAEFAGTLTKLRHKERPCIVIDARELEYVNSRAMGQLVTFSRDVRLVGGKVMLVQPGRAMTKILRAVGLLSLIPSFEGLEEAIAACEPAES